MSTTLLNNIMAGPLQTPQLASQSEVQARLATKAAAANQLPRVLLAAPITITSAQAFVAFTNLNTTLWERFFLDFTGLTTSTVDVNVGCQFSVDNGATWVITGYNNQVLYQASTAVASWGHGADGTNAGLFAAVANISNSGYGPDTNPATGGMSGVYEVQNLGSTTERKRWTTASSGNRSGYTTRMDATTTHTSNLQVANALRVITSTGTINTGTFRIYGQPYAY